ncbi:MAG: hypothetical protein XD91_0283 [Clostridiales bacterium 38_11]|nr:MAG: hypothetical protein XD91_0283 [Clostridiales bacterium 38_11]
MKIKVYPPTFIKADVLDMDNYIEIDEGGTVRQIYDRLGIPVVLSPLVYCVVNYKKTKLDTPLKKGDIVSFISFLSGG